MLGWPRPGHIRAHAVPLHALPPSRLGPQFGGAVERGHERLARDRAEMQPGRVFGYSSRSPHVDDGIGEPANFRDNRYRAVAQRAQLRQPAWLES